MSTFKLKALNLPFFAVISTSTSCLGKEFFRVSELLLTNLDAKFLLGIFESQKTRLAQHNLEKLFVKRVHRGFSDDVFSF